MFDRHRHRQNYPKISWVPLTLNLPTWTPTNGVGGLSWAFIAQEFDKRKDPDGMPGTIRLLVADVATLGRDVLEDLNVVFAAMKEGEYLQIKDQKYRDQKNPKS